MYFGSRITHIVVTCFIMVDGVKRKMHPAVKLCHRYDPQISECFCDNLGRLIPIFKDGVPEMNLPPLDPIILDNIVLDFMNTPSVKLTANLFNITITGLSVLKIKHCDFKLIGTNAHLHVEYTFPTLAMTTYCNVFGTAFFLNLNATGDFDAQISDVFFRGKWVTSNYMKEGKKYMNVVANIDNYTSRNLKVHFGKLFGNNTELNQHVNTVISENIEALYTDMKPLILEVLKDIADNITNHVYGAFPYDVLFPE